MEAFSSPTGLTIGFVRGGVRGKAGFTCVSARRAALSSSRSGPSRSGVPSPAVLPPAAPRSTTTSAPGAGIRTAPRGRRSASAAAPAPVPPGKATTVPGNHCGGTPASSAPVVEWRTEQRDVPQSTASTPSTTFPPAGVRRCCTVVRRQHRRSSGASTAGRRVANGAQRNSLYRDARPAHARAPSAVHLRRTVVEWRGDPPGYCLSPTTTMRGVSKERVAPP